MRFIKYNITPGSEGHKRFAITGQGDRGREFSEKTGSVFTAKNGVKLHSCSFPAWDPHEAGLYVRGSDTGWDHQAIEISDDRWPDVKAAIDEYNARYSSAAVLINSCDALTSGAMAADLGGAGLCLGS